MDKVIKKKINWNKLGTILVNFGVFAALVAQGLAGANVISEKEAAIALSVGNALVRMFGKDPVRMEEE
ncbi:MAG: hypothetical protein DRI01_01920 [Chloroflexi bacterium]|nr:MAG: hypothetical protein DRI01_01920 [Chloroflexota bacterium]